MEAATSVVTHQRTLGALAIALLTFANVAGSPIGIEDAVGAGGAFGCVVLIFIMALVWAAPQALITAELSTAFPVSGGGTVTWVDEAWGPVIGTANSWLVLINNLIDMPMYPLIFAQAVASLWPELDAPGPTAALCAGILGIALALNACGAEAMASSTEWLTGIILVPFAIMPLVSAFTGPALDFRALGPAGVPSVVNVPVLMSSVQWNMMGWSFVGALAADTRDPGRNFPRGIMSAVVPRLGGVRVADPVGLRFRPRRRGLERRDASQPSQGASRRGWASGSLRQRRSRE